MLIIAVPQITLFVSSMMTPIMKLPEVPTDCIVQASVVLSMKTDFHDHHRLPA